MLRLPCWRLLVLLRGRFVVLVGPSLLFSPDNNLEQRSAVTVSSREAFPRRCDVQGALVVVVGDSYDAGQGGRMRRPSFGESHPPSAVDASPYPMTLL